MHDRAIVFRVGGNQRVGRETAAQSRFFQEGKEALNVSFTQKGTVH